MSKMSDRQLKQLMDYYYDKGDYEGYEMAHRELMKRKEDA